MSWVSASLCVYIIILALSIGIALIANWFSEFVPEMKFVSLIRKNALGLLLAVLFLILILSFWSYKNQKGLDHVPLYLIIFLLNIIGLISLTIILRIKWKIIESWKKIIFLSWILIFLPLTSVLLFLMWVMGGRGID